MVIWTPHFRAKGLIFIPPSLCFQTKRTLCIIGLFLPLVRYFVKFFNGHFYVVYIHMSFVLVRSFLQTDCGIYIYIPVASGFLPLVSSAGAHCNSLPCLVVALLTFVPSLGPRWYLNTSNIAPIFIHTNTYSNAQSRWSNNWHEIDISKLILVWTELNNTLCFSLLLKIYFN